MAPKKKSKVDLSHLRALVQLEKEPPTVYRIQLFLRWFAETRTGQLEDIITDTTLRNHLSSLKRAIKTHTSH
jgi:hypothetical protein